MLNKGTLLYDIDRSVKKSDFASLCLSFSFHWYARLFVIGFHDLILESVRKENML